MKKLKNRPLAIQIWIISTLVIVIVFGLLSVYFSLTIRTFFTNETYKTIETAQENLIKKSMDRDDLAKQEDKCIVSNDIRAVKHLRLKYNNDKTNLVKIQKFIPRDIAAKLFLKKLKKQAKNQKLQLKDMFKNQVLENTICNQSKRVNKKGNFVVSYMWDTYKNSLYRNLIRRLFSIMLIALIICLIASKYMAQKLVLPLRELQTKVKNRKNTMA